MMKQFRNLNSTQRQKLKKAISLIFVFFFFISYVIIFTISGIIFIITNEICINVNIITVIDFRVIDLGMLIHNTYAHIFF